MQTTIDYSDQIEIFDPAGFGWPVHLIGLGGIGSAAVLPLMKLGIPEIHLWDDDEIEPHNVPCELVYRPSDVGTPKVVAAAGFLQRQEADCAVYPHGQRIGSSDSGSLDGIVISGVDSMESRREIWEAIKLNPGVALYMDGRIGGEQLELLCCRPCDLDDIEWYEGELFLDDEAVPLPCAARTVIHPAVALSSLMVAQLTRFVREIPLEQTLMWHLRTMQYM